MQNLISLFQQYTGQLPKNMEPLPKTGSNRLYVRLTSSDDSTVIGVVNSNIAENRSFIYLSRHFGSKGFPVPQILAVGKEENCYLQTDLGHTTLYGVLKESRQAGGFGDAEFALIDRTLRLLAHLQTEGARGLDFQQCLSPNTFDVMSAMFDLNYFKYCFLKATGMEFQEDRLEDDFQKMADVLLRNSSATFMYRDFQSRNVMVKNGEPWFIDFQGGRKGPIYYDVASFLWQAKAKYPAELRQELIADYLQALRGYMDIDEKHFFRQLRHFVLFRTLQVLGAYGFRGYFEKKPHFIQSVPFAIDNLRQLLKEDYPEYPYLCTVLRELTNLSQFYDDIQKHTLKVKIVSFAYKKGIPNDPSGNGGGFVFDCRAINNPGKYERYNHFTGLDEPVIRFLEEDGEITRFLDHAYEIVDASVKRYMDRGFTNLMICFGCTGGQHRSVYSAQHMAEHIHSKFGVRVDLVHREQNIEQLFNAIL